MHSLGVVAHLFTVLVAYFFTVLNVLMVILFIIIVECLVALYHVSGINHYIVYYFVSKCDREFKASLT